MSCMGLEPTIPMFKREKTDHALDRAATVIGTHTRVHLYLHIMILEGFFIVLIVQFMRIRL
jgi:hypothetical protein